MGRERQPIDFEPEIRKIFGDEDIRVMIDVDSRQLRFNLETAYGSRTLDQLDALSKLLGTRKINLNKAFEANSGCSSCGDGYSIVVPISCSDVIFYPCLFKVDDHECKKHSTNVTNRFCELHAALRCSKCGKQAKKTISGGHLFSSEKNDSFVFCSECHL